MNEQKFNFEPATAAFHNSQMAKIGPVSGPMFMHRYVTSHEGIHDAIFRLTPDGQLHALLDLINRDARAFPHADIEDVVTFLWNDLRTPHERSATYTAAHDSMDTIERGFFIRSLNREYFDYYSYFDKLISSRTLCDKIAFHTATAITGWAFSSERTELVTPDNVFDIETYRKIPGPRERMDAFAREIGSGGTQRLIREASEHTKHHLGITDRDFNSDDFWNSNQRTPENSLRQEYTGHLSREINLALGIPTTEKAFSSLPIYAFLTQYFHIKNIDHRSTEMHGIPSENTLQLTRDRANFGHRFQLLNPNTINPLNSHSFSLDSMLQELEQRRHVSVTMINSDLFIIREIRYYEDPFGTNERNVSWLNYNNTKQLIDSLFRSADYSAHFTPVVFCITPQSATHKDKIDTLIEEIEDIFDSLFTGWALCPLREASNDCDQTGPRVTIVGFVSKGWPGFLEERTGHLTVGAFDPGLLNNTPAFVLSTFEVHDTEVSFVNLCLDVEHLYRLDFLKYLTDAGSLTVENLGEVPLTFPQIALCCWDSLAKLGTPPRPSPTTTYKFSYLPSASVKT